MTLAVRPPRTITPLAGNRLASIADPEHDEAARLVARAAQSDSEPAPVRHAPRTLAWAAPLERVLSPLGGGGGGGDGGEEITKLRSAAGPTLPTWSIARTLTACVPPRGPVLPRARAGLERTVAEAALEPGPGLARERDPGGRAADRHASDGRCRCRGVHLVASGHAPDQRRHRVVRRCLASRGTGSSVAQTALTTAPAAPTGCHADQDASGVGVFPVRVSKEMSCCPGSRRPLRASARTCG